MQLAIIADDLTGAADSAGAFADRALSTIVCLRSDAIEDADVVSLTTDSRDRPVEEAKARVAAAVRELLSHSAGDPPLVYKKMDSALRGNPAAELFATMGALGVDRAIVAPALPGEGRTTVGGRQLCDGRPLHKSAIGRGLGSSSLIELFGLDSPETPVRLVSPSELRTQGPGVFIADAATDDELNTIAISAKAAGFRLFAGSAGLSRAIARVGGLTPRVACPIAWVRRPGPVLSVVGSQHDSTLRQIEYAAAQGIDVYRPAQAEIDDPAGTISDTITKTEAALSAGRHVIVTTAGMANSPLGSIAVAARLATVLGSNPVRGLAAGLFFAGGDVAAAVCERLGTTSIWLSGEVSPAIPMGRLANGCMQGTPVVTKAGSFGGPETLVRCIARLASG